MTLVFNAALIIELLVISAIDPTFSVGDFVIGGERSCDGVTPSVNLFNPWPLTDILKFGTSYACYWMETTEEPIVWADAQAACAVQGGRLATFPTAEARHRLLDQFFFDLHFGISTAEQMVWNGMTAKAGQFSVLGRLSPNKTEPLMAWPLSEPVRDGCGYNEALSVFDVVFDARSCAADEPGEHGITTYICRKDVGTANYKHRAGKNFNPAYIRETSCMKSEFDCIGFTYSPSAKDCKLAKPVDPEEVFGVLEDAPEYPTSNTFLMTL